MESTLMLIICQRLLFITRYPVYQCRKVDTNENDIFNIYQPNQNYLEYESSANTAVSAKNEHNRKMINDKYKMSEYLPYRKSFVLVQ
jgi:hypothetical protein